jgi:hypothetical protein
MPTIQTNSNVVKMNPPDYVAWEVLHRKTEDDSGPTGWTDRVSDSFLGLDDARLYGLVCGYKWILETTYGENDLPRKTEFHRIEAGPLTPEQRERVAQFCPAA